MNDEQYFRYLLTSYQKLIYAICHKAVGNPFDAEDLTQEVYLSVYRNLSTFDRQYEKAWICKIASNKCKDFLKSAKRRVLPAQEETFVCLADLSDTPEEACLKRESTDAVWMLCQGLKEPYRTVATEHFCHEKSVAEIALEQKKPMKTVQTQVYRAKAMLKKSMRGEGYC